MTIAQDLRTECARILARNFGLPNELAAIKISTVQRLDAYVADAEDRAAACTCERVPVFDPFRRETRLDYDFKLARFRRMAREEAA